MKWSREEFEQSTQILVKVLEDQQRASDDGGGQLVHWQLEYHQNKNSHESILYLVHAPIIMNDRSGDCCSSGEEEIVDDDTTTTIHQQDNNDTTWSLEDETILLDPDSLDKSTTTTITTNDDNTQTDKNSISNNVNQSTQWFFSVVYSDTWQVPILYFTVQGWSTDDNKNGSPCTRSEVLDLLLNNYSNENTIYDGFDTWDFISQEEHPITGIPCFFLHPCQTEHRLKVMIESTLASSSSPNYDENTTVTATDDGSCLLTNGSILWSWMSMILPSVNCPISSSYFQSIQNQLVFSNIK